MAIEDEIRTVLEAKAEALVAQHAGNMDGLIHNDFIYVNSGGRTFDKAGYIETTCTSGKMVFKQQRITDLTVKLIGSSAVATFSIDDEFTIEGREVSGRYRSLCVFSQFSGHWLWIAGQTMNRKTS